MYIASVNRKWETLSNDPAKAVRLAEERQGKLLVAAANPNCNEPVTLAKAFERWLQDVKDSGWDSSTVDAKTRIAEQFQVHCSGITMLSELTRSHCLTWINTSLVERGNGDRTRNVKGTRLNQFLKFHHVADAHGDRTSNVRARARSHQSQT